MSSIQELEAQRKTAEVAVAKAQLPFLQVAAEKLGDPLFIQDVERWANGLVDVDAKGALTNLIACMQSTALVLQFAIARNTGIAGQP